MTAHVAERGEGRGRVVVVVGCTQPVSRPALAAAVHVAAAYHAEIDAVFVEDRQLADAAAFDFAQEIPLRGTGGPRALELERLVERMRDAARGVRHDLAALARAADVPVRHQHLRSTPLRAMAEACREMGPWNVVAQCRPISVLALTSALRLFDQVTGMTGVLVGGCGSDGALPAGVAGPRRGGGRPVVAVIEDFERLAGMLRTASRLARVDGSEVCLALTAPRRAALDWLAAEVRESLGKDASGVHVQRLETPGGGAAVIAEALRRLDPGFLVAAHDGLAVAAEDGVRSLAGILRAPLLLVR